MKNILHGIAAALAIIGFVADMFTILNTMTIIELLRDNIFKFLFFLGAFGLIAGFIIDIMAKQKEIEAGYKKTIEDKDKELKNYINKQTRELSNNIGSKNEEQKNAIKKLQKEIKKLKTPDDIL